MIRHTFDAALDRAAELAIDPLIGDRFAWQSTAPRARYCRLAEIGATRAAPVFELGQYRAATVAAPPPGGEPPATRRTT
ncbi:MAG TPA: hypothetical protein VHT91_16035 [Kofleriaceae bacterium]|jgi:hypothetical protein|nr:hypothetical protein [Kofleriaceae bacterium]